MKHEVDKSVEYMLGFETIPETRYTHYRYFIKNGDRKAYEAPYFQKRRAMAALALRVFLGETHWKDLLAGLPVEHLRRDHLGAAGPRTARPD